MRAFALALLLAAAFAVPAAAQEPPAVPAAAPSPAPAGQDGTFEEVRDRILYSLFFRGEVADAIIGAGLAGDFVEAGEGEPYSEIRERMLYWIRSNPDEAARVYRKVRSGAASAGGAMPHGLPAQFAADKEYTFEISPHFVGLIRSLAAAAGDPRASDEDLAGAGRRLFEGLPADPDSYAGGAMRPGPPENGTAEDGASLINADFRLDKKALSASARRLGTWADSALKDLEQARGPRSDRRAGLVKKAFADYRGLLAAASSVSGRERITAAEAERLERLRLSVRGGLSASSLLSAADDLDSMADLMEKRGRPSSARRARLAAAELDGAGSRIESGKAAAGEISRLVHGGESLYLAASFGARAALLLANMAETASVPRFSCLYDALADLYFRRTAPSSAYSRARLLLEGLGRAAPAAAGLAERGDFEGAFSVLSDASGSGTGPESAASGFGEAMKLSAAVSRANARAQYLAGGALLNPFGLEFGPAGFRLAGLFPGSR